MKKTLLLAALIAISSALTGCGGVIDTGNVGVRTSWGHTSNEEVGEGVYTSFLSSVDEYTVKQIAINLDGMTPKAHDNLSLKELDVTVYYNIDSTRVAETAIKYSGQSIKDGTFGNYMPAYNLVSTQAQSAIQKAVSDFDSLIIHTKRDEIENEVKRKLQEKLDGSDPGTFKIAAVTVRKVVTDGSIEESIRDQVRSQKENETLTTKLDTAGKQAKLNEKLNDTYTPGYLQHEYNMALQACASNPKCTLIVGDAKPLVNIK